MVEEEKLLDGFTTGQLRELCEANERGELDLEFLPFWFNRWKYLTRMLINNGKYVLLYTTLEDIQDQVQNNQWEDFKPPRYQPRVFKDNSYLKQLRQSVKITEIAMGYGLEVKKSKTICPFHEDTDPSLSFSDEKGVFHCFGCGAKGDILTFIKKMEEKKNGNKRRS